MDFRATDAAPQETSASLTTVYGTYFVEVPQADLTLTELFEDVIEPLILAAGYSQQLIDEAMGRDVAPPPSQPERYRDEDALEQAAKMPYEKYYNPEPEHLYRPEQTYSSAASGSLAEVRRAVEEGLDKTRQFNDSMNRVPATTTAEANRIKPL